MQNTNSENKLIQCLDTTQKISYPKAPPKNDNLRLNDKITSLTSNLMKLTISQPMKKIYVYSIEIQPEIAKDNFTLQIKIYKNLQPELSNYFIKYSFAGYNMFAVPKMHEKEIIIKETIEGEEYRITFREVSSLSFEEIIDNQEINLKKKAFVEKLIKDILLSSKDTIRFGSDRMIIQMNKENVMKGNDGSSIYKGFYTSAQITESGLYLMVLNMNKYISGKTMYDKIKQIKSENSKESENEIRALIEDYIEEHKTVLTTYGSFRAYRIEKIDFEKTPLNTSCNIKTSEGPRTVTIYNYYEKQYKLKIQDKNQPLLVAERKINEKKLLTDNSNKNIDNIIYLVPELVLITGIENDKSGRSRRQDIITKTKTNPSQRMNEINKIHDLMNNETPKKYKNNTKSSKELAEDWGINLGENLTLEGRILSQPTLIFAKHKEVIPRNGIFRTDVTYNGVEITRDNLMYIYSRRDKADIRSLMNGLLNKASSKGIEIRAKSNDLYSYGINKTYSWEEIKSELKNIHFSHKLRMIIVFCDQNIQRCYNKFKEYLTNVIKIDSQFINTRNLIDPKRAGSIMFNIVEQINTKMGGINFYIDFNKILDKNKIYLILGLESKKVGKDSIDYVLTYTYNSKLSRTHSIPRNCKDNKEDKEKTLNELMDEALKGLREIGKAPHPPNFIIIYRQGGNHVQNLKLSKDEVPIFVKYVNNKKEKSEKFKDLKLIYICCNLKGDLKFFEENRNQRYDNYNNRNEFNKYQNPSSGLCVDGKVTQKDKYEFFIQPQFVNQGTATPCHYEVLYQDYDEKNPESNLSLESLQNLSFQLSFYYWTWSGAIRVPSVLKLSTTALDYFSKCLNHKLNLEGQKFKTPGFI